MRPIKKTTIFFVGGGTGGPTAPILAVTEKLKKMLPAAKIYFVGTGRGVERQLVGSLETLKIPAGKLRRYFSLLNLIDLVKIAAGFIKSLYLIYKYRPRLIFGAGSYVQVPMVWAGFFCRVPVIVHQQDLKILLSTKLCRPVADLVTVSLQESRTYFSSTSSGLVSQKGELNVVWTGNPVRSDIVSGSVEKARKFFSLNASFPTVLVTGGGSGSRRMNEVLTEALPELVKYVQVIHLTGGRALSGFRSPNYHFYGFLAEEMRDAYAAADLVVCRSGMSTLSELSVLGKPALTVPLPNSPQEGNASYFADKKAAVVVFEEFFNAELLVKLIRKILWDIELQKCLKRNIGTIMPKDADVKIAMLIKEMIKGQ